MLFVMSFCWIKVDIVNVIVNMVNSGNKCVKGSYCSFKNSEISFWLKMCR